MLIDVHVHSSYTEGVEADPREILEAAREAGLDGVCFTDRDATKNAVELICLGAEVGVEVFIGLELATDHGVLLGFAPRIDDFYLDEQWRQLSRAGTPNAQQTIELFDRVGGVVIAAYPYDMNIPWASGDRIFELKGLRGIEAFVPRLDSSRNAMAIEAARALDVPMLGGSDFRGDLARIGEAATLFPKEIVSQSELVAALRGDCWAVALGIEIKDPKPRPREERRDDRRGGRGRDGGRSGGRGRDGGRDGGRGGRSGGRGRDGDRSGRGGGRGRDGDRGGRRPEGGRDGNRNGNREGGRDGNRRGSRDGGARRSGGERSGGGGRSRRPRRD